MRASILLCLCGLSCGEPAAVPAAQGRVASQQTAPGALVMVNGVPITDADIDLAAGRGGHDGEELSEAQRANLLNVIIDKELRAQQAEALGLDQAEAYQEKLQELQARVNAHRREALANRYFKQQIVKQATVSEAEARAYFDAHTDEIRTETHVRQILKKSRPEIEAVQAALAGGTPFEEVAAAQFPRLPAASPRPWDPGWLKWTQIPPAWAPVLEGMKPGEVSGIIDGGRRFWIIQLADRRVNDTTTFAEVQPVIQTRLEQEKIERLAAESDAALRKAAGL